MSLPFIILASKDDIRVDLFQQALHQQGLTAAKVISYLDFIKSPSMLSQVLQEQSHILRIDSPGRDINAHAAILEHGILPLKTFGQTYQTASEIRKKLQQKGRIIAPQQFYAGFNSLMNTVNTQLPDHTHVMNHPDDIMLAFDKSNCQQALQQAGILIPECLGEVNNYDQLRTKMQLKGMPRVFIKLKHGSAASGIIALETSKNRVQIKTTIELIHEKDGNISLYNTRQIQRCNKEPEIQALVDTLCKMEVQVERWIPKAQVDDYNVDLRILMIAGKAQHQVLRMSKSPMTNLHLLNQRADANRLKQKMTIEAWDAMIHSCERAAKVFSKSLYIALDVVVSINLKQHFIIEVNAFGDLLKDTYFNGLSPQEAEIYQLKHNVY